MLFGDGSITAKQAVEFAKGAVRSTANFNWSSIFFLVVVLLVYFYAVYKKNYNAVFGSLALYGVHWFYEIMNACICAGTGYPLWTVTPGSTSYILLIGVSIELSLMFALSGFTSILLPEQKKITIKNKFTINTRVVYVLFNAALAAILEIFLASTPAFIWVYKWWGTIPVFITTYIPFFLAAALVHDAPRKTQIISVSTIVAVDILLLCILVPLGII